MLLQHNVDLATQMFQLLALQKEKETLSAMQPQLAEGDDNFGNLRRKIMARRSREHSNFTDIIFKEVPGNH